jgi:hypothetical protein
MFEFDSLFRKYFDLEIVLTVQNISEVGIANFFLSPLIANPLIFFESAKR